MKCKTICQLTGLNKDCAQLSTKEVYGKTRDSLSAVIHDLNKLFLYLSAYYFDLFQLHRCRYAGKIPTALPDWSFRIRLRHEQSDRLKAPWHVPSFACLDISDATEMNRYQHFVPRLSSLRYSLATESGRQLSKYKLLTSAKILSPFDLNDI